MGEEGEAAIIYYQGSFIYGNSESALMLPVLHVLRDLEGLYLTASPAAEVPTILPSVQARRVVSDIGTKAGETISRYGRTISSTKFPELATGARYGMLWSK